MSEVRGEHEVLRAFDEAGCSLDATLLEMLDDHAKHRTERRGSGYTQASRHLAKHINKPRLHDFYEEILLFADRDSSQLRALLDGAAARGVAFSWRNLDVRPPPVEMRDEPVWCALYEAEAHRQGGIRCVVARLEREESRLLAGMLCDLVLAPAPEPDVTTLTPWPDALAIGTCPLAEKYFLEVACGTVRRAGRMNVLVSDAGEPLLIEKIGLGDSHSCISVAPLRLNDTRLPPGSLLGVAYEGDVAVRENRSIPGAIIPVSRCAGFSFLRLTTLAISPANRPRAFTAHFEAQVEGGLWRPGQVTIADLAAQAQLQL